ncbi:disease resistance protein RPV1 [Trifolium repens]|nr:disease resistance protein RPV1 [Trifolium repens]
MREKALPPPSPPSPPRMSTWDFLNLFDDEFNKRTYDVFLSFRGEDSRAKFIAHLHSSLKNAGIYVFKDDDGIQRGDQISDSLLGAIDQSNICIVVLSTNYANSKWCMMELERIVETSRIKGTVVVPVFYEVDPSDVRNQTGTFGEQFDYLISKKEVDEKSKMNWKTALREVGARVGVVIINSRNESEDIKKIVEIVTRLLDKTELFVADYPVGVESRIGMHDLLRDMGREIVRKKSKEGGKEPSRLWRYEDVLHELSKDISTLDVKGITLKMSRMDSTTSLETKAFEKMDKLRLLQLSGVQLDGDYKYLSRHLRWLSWHGFPLKFTPADFHQQSLVAVDLKYSKLERVWRKSQLLVNLKILNLSHSHNLRHTPDFSNLPNLEKLMLKDCPSLSSVSSNIGQLKKILLINLKDCTGLCELPRSIYKLDSLKTLILSGCTKIDKLEEDIEQMKSLTTLVADNTAITRVPFAVVRSKNIAYISLCGYEGFARKVFPSIIQSWLSPTNNVLSLVQISAGTPCLDFTDEQNKSFYCLPSTFEDFQNLQRLWLKCDSEAQLNHTVESILNSFNTHNCEGFSNIGTSASIRSQVGISSAKNSLTSLLIRMGMSCNVTDILTENILQKIPPTGSGLLPGDNSPNWLTFNSNDSSVTFEVPQVDRLSLKTVMCIVYSSSADNATTEGFKVVLVINYTKNTIQVYKSDGLLDSSDEEEWQRVIANIEPGNKIKVVVGFTNEFIVKKTTVYLVYDEPNDIKIKNCYEPDENGIVSGGDENSGCNYFNWDYEEVADEKDLIIMKHKRRLEVDSMILLISLLSFFLGWPLFLRCWDCRGTLSIDAGVLCCLCFTLLRCILRFSPDAKLMSNVWQ